MTNLRLNALVVINLVITPKTVVVILKRPNLVDHKNKETTLLLAPKKDDKDTFSLWYSESSIKQEVSHWHDTCCAPGIIVECGLAS